MLSLGLYMRLSKIVNMEVQRSEGGGLKFGDMVWFSLKFMFKRWDTLYFFIPVLVVKLLSLLYMIDVVTRIGISTFDTGEPKVIDMINLITQFAITQLILLFIIWIFNSYAVMCVYVAAYRQFRKKRWNAWDLMQEYIGKLPGFLAISFLVDLIVSIPVLIVGIFAAVTGPLAFLLLVLVLPAMVYIGIRLSVSNISYVIEGKSITGAIDRSLFLTKDKFWYVFGCSLAFGILIGIITSFGRLIIKLPFMVLGGGELAYQPFSIISIKILSSLLTYPIDFYYSIAIGSFSFLIFASLVFMKGKREVEKPPEPKLDIIR